MLDKIGVVKGKRKNQTSNVNQSLKLFLLIAVNIYIFCDLNLMYISLLIRNCRLWISTENRYSNFKNIYHSARNQITGEGSFFHNI